MFKLTSSEFDRLNRISGGILGLVENIAFAEDGVNTLDTDAADQYVDIISNLRPKLEKLYRKLDRLLDTIDTRGEDTL